MNEELYNHLYDLFNQSRFVEIRLQGDFQDEDYRILIDKFDDFNLREVRIDRGTLYHNISEMNISFAQVIK